MLKGVKFLIASIFAALLLASPVGALSFGALEKISEDSPNIELSTPEEGYSFDATFLDKNQTLSYQTTITNDSPDEAKIQEINLESSQHSFLEYSYSGISVDDVIPSGESRTITLTIQTNSNDTQTVDEDYSLSINYHNIDPISDEDNPDDNPNTSSGAIKIISIAAISLSAGIFVFARNKKMRHFAFIFALPFAGLFIVSNANAENGALQNLTILGKVRFINTYTISINPNGGEYDGSTNIKTLRIRDGEDCELGNDPTRDTYSFSGWSYNGEPLTENTFTVTEDAEVIANWEEIFHTITINPNGGTYDGDLSQQIRDGAIFHIGANPTRATYTFTGWETNPDNINPNADITVRQDISFKALWNENYIDVTIDPNGGEYGGYTAAYTESYREGDEITMGDATREHFRFTGWAMSVGELDSENKFIVSQTVTLTAQWEEIKFTLTINPNGGEYDGHTSEYSHDYQEGTVVNLTTPTKEHNHFTYWTLEDDSQYTNSSVTINRDITLTAHYDLDIFHVVIDPNGGTYNNSAAIYEDDLVYGTVLPLASVTARENYVLAGWTKNATGSLDRDAEEITITENTTLKAIWNETRLVTVYPNGGVYDNSANPSEYRVEKDTTFTLQEATRDNYAFDYWTVNDTDRLDGNDMIISEDTTFRAEWFFPVARIERTQKLYPSIMAAHDEAISDDIITLLVDTEEVVRNEKKVTLDLNHHTVTGYLYNTAMGDIVLVNGEINNYNSPIHNEENPSAAAVVNAGKLTMGIDDYTGGETNQKAPLISSDNIRLVGSDIGIAQTGQFYFYDGFIEGVIGLAGGYDGSPWYRDTFDGVVVHYFPFVDRNTEKDCQHVSLENSDKAVSKTIDGGEIYYYNLQDNINTSAITGYDMYAVRNFDASYPITVTENDEIVFDLDGYTVDFGEDSTVNGSLTIRDSKTGEEAGMLEFAKTMTNNGTLAFSNAKAKAITVNNLLVNNGSLVMRNSTISADKSIAVVVQQNGSSYDLDNDSYIRTSSSDKPAIQNYSTDLNITSGHIVSNGYIAIKNMRNSALTISGGEVSVANTNVNYGCAVYGDSDNMTLTMTGGKVTATSTSGYSATAICGMHADISGGEVSATSNAEATAINGGSRTINISNDAAISATTTANHTARAASGNWQTLTISGDNTVIRATAAGNGAALISDGDYGSTTINGGTLTTETTNGTAYITNDMEKTITINGGTMTAHSTNGDVLAIGTSGRWSSSIYINGGKINAIADNPDKVATGVCSYVIRMTDGEIYASTYGIREMYISSLNENYIHGGKVEGGKYGIYNTTITLGINDIVDNHSNISITDPEIKGGIHAIYGNETIFYDGILKGDSTYINNENVIIAIPDGSHRHVEQVGDEEHCWLEEDDDYLEVNGETFNSLTGAYAAVEDGGTINVIADASTAAVLPNNAKNITFNLGNHTVTYMQPLLNSGSITITGTGNLINASSSFPTINNSGTVTIESGHIISNNYVAIKVTRDATLNITGGEVSVLNNKTNYDCAISGDVNTTLNMTGGKVTSTSTSGYNTTTICSINANISGGEVSSTSNAEATAIGGYSRTINISNGAVISATTTANHTARATTGNWQTLTISGDDTIVRATAAGNGSALISDGDYGSTTINGGTITTETVNGTAFITNDMEKTITITGGTMTAHSTNGEALAIGTTGRWSSSVNISGGSINAIADNPDKIATGVCSYVIHMTGGEIYASTYGVRDMYSGNIDDNYIRSGKVEGGKYGISNVAITIGTNDIVDGRSNISITDPEIKGGTNAINGGSIYFYDGILKGGEHYINDASLVRAVPDGSHRHVEQVGDEEHCWLEEDDDYLEVNGETFNSLTGAYAAVENDGTINVIADASTPAVLPSNTKNITFNLGNHTLNYQQPLKNSGTITFVGTGYIINNNNSTPTIENSGNITIESGHIVSDGADAIKNLSGSSLTITGGEIYTANATADSPCTIRGESTNSSLTMTGGKVSAATNQQRTVTAICGMHANISGGEVSATSKGDATAIGGYSRTINISNGAVITATSTNGGSARATSGNWQTLSISGDDTIVRATANGGGYATISDGDYGSTTINGGTLTTETENGSATITNDMEKTITINGGTMTAHSANGDAYGIGTSGRWAPYITINDGKITAIADNPDKPGTGVYGYNVTVTGGEIYGSTYGIRDVYTNSTIIGVNDNTVNNGLDGTSDKPYIHGGSYGIYSSSFSFYDGIIEGGIAPHFDRNIKTIASGTNVFYDQNIIDGETFKTAYLIAEQDVARIGDAADAPVYKSLDAAITDAQAGDTIYLIRDAYTYTTLNIPSSKQFTLDLNGHNIIAANHIDNSGDVTIVNNNTDRTVVEYHDSDPFIQNRAGAKLTLDGLELKSNRIAENYGELTFVDSALKSYTNTNEHLIRNYNGIFNLDSSVIQTTSDTYPIYLDNGGFNIADSEIHSKSNVYVYNLGEDSTISNSTLDATADFSNYVFNINYNTAKKLTVSDNSKLHGDIYVKEAGLEIKDTQIENTHYRDENFIHLENNTTVFDNVTVQQKHANYWNYNGYRTMLYNNSNTTIKNSDFEQFTIGSADTWPGKQLRIITNAGTLAIESTNLKQNDVNSNVLDSIAIYNSGTLSMLDSTVTTTRSLTSVYGLYNDGTATIDASTITVSGKNAYGIYANAGELTLGEAEPQYLPDGTANPNYGKATANVSTTSPLISAIGTNNGVAATINAGKLNFYDGKFYQSNPNGPALQPDGSPVALTKVEYLYQAEGYQDIYDNYYFILEFMRTP